MNRLPNQLFYSHNRLLLIKYNNIKFNKLTFNQQIIHTVTLIHKYSYLHHQSCKISLAAYPLNILPILLIIQREDESKAHNNNILMNA